MKKIFTYALIAGLGLSLASCSNDEPGDGDEQLTANEKAMQKVVNNTVNNIIIPTYSNLADRTDLLLSNLEKLAQSRTQANVNAVCDAWKQSRQWWEWSEAFLYGAASNYGIDPHIDTWPLDKNELVKLLNNKAQIESLDAESAGANFGPGLLGFHGLEYIIFRNGQPRTASEITDDEMKYALAVAGDLRHQCYRLEAAWAGMDSIASAKKSLLEEIEMEPTDNFGEYMLNAGSAGSIHKYISDAMEEILDGCETIADEVASTKMGVPNSKEDVNYIESPYSWNSLQDFEDNILGIQYVYFGAVNASSPADNSVSSFIASQDKQADQDIRNAITKSLNALKACERPFVQNYGTANVEAAMAAISELTDALNAAKKYCKK